MENHSCHHGNAPEVNHHPGDHRPSAQRHLDSACRPSSKAKYYCPMCPGVESDEPGECPKCGMALERNPAWIPPWEGKTIHTRPVHPEVQQDHPGDCPKCGMALEPKTVSPQPDRDNSELAMMTRRFWISAALTLPVSVMAMVHLVPSLAHSAWVSGEVS